MKLIDLLVKELPQRGGWPEGAEIAVQDSDSQICFSSHSDVYANKGQTDWYGGDWGDGDWSNPFIDTIADDRHECIVSRKQYEAALAASKAVVGHNGWIQWAGGECPVDSDAIVEVKFRHPSSNQFNSDRAGDFYWPHDGLGYDIIAYRLRQPAKSEQVRDDAAEADDEADLNECIGQDFDVVNHLSHYTKGRIECIDAIDSATAGKSGIEAVCVANIIKYLFRYEEKNGLEDVKKAKWYLNKLISELESK